MKRIFLFLVVILISGGLVAQKRAQSKPGLLRIVEDDQNNTEPAILNIVPGSVRFVDATGNKAIDANEVCKLVFQVSNSGMSAGQGCVAKLTSKGSIEGISFEGKQRLNTIPINGSQTVEFPISADMNTADGRVEFTIQVEDLHGTCTSPINIDIATLAFVAPHLQITDYTITGESAALEKKTPFNLQLLLQNTDYGLAEDILVSIAIPDNTMLLDGEEQTYIAKLSAGQTKPLEYALIANNSYASQTIPIEIHIQEKHGKYAEDRVINLQINQAFSSTKLSTNEDKQVREKIQIATLTSEVDKNIPQNPISNTNTFAFIIANEHYQNSSFAHVPFAANDGRIFSDYCHNTLGIPSENIHLHTDVTFAGMLSLISQLKTTALVNPNSHIIFYYAGHGAPSEETQEAYIIPVDAFQINPQVCFNLQALYDDFKKLKDSRVTVFLDACFSGVNRDNTMLASARGVAIAPKEQVVGGNLVVFSAASGNETAWPYKEQSHGLFTYFLLKKLQETKGDVTYQELYEYLSQNVRRISNNINHKLQTPTINTSSNVHDEWQTWKLR